MSALQSRQGSEPVLWLALPFAACVLATIMLDTPIRVWGLRLPEPVFAFVPAFAWAVARPSVSGPILLLFLGVFLDLCWGASLGLTAIELILAYGFVIATRSIMTGQGPLMMFGWYAAACLIGFAGGYLLTMLDVLSTPNLVAVFLQYAVTIALYPLTVLLIQRFEDTDVRYR